MDWPSKFSVNWCMSSSEDHRYSAYSEITESIVFCKIPLKFRKETV